MKLESLLTQLKVGLGLSALFLLAGCFDTKQEFTINPDGSGKVVHECSFQTLALDSDKRSPEEALRKAVGEVIEKSKGVDVWREVSFKQLDDGRLFFRGTAYFKSLSRLDIPSQTALGFAWTRQGDDKAVLSLRSDATSSPAASAAATGSADEQAVKTREARAKYQQAKPMLIAFLATTKQEVVFHLPGKLRESSNFTKDPTGALRIRFEGAKLLEAIDKLATDDAWVQRNVGSLGSPAARQGRSDEVLAMLYGTKAPIRAAVNSLSAPLFDYAAEVAAAQKEFAKAQKELGISVISTPAAAPGKPLKSLKVAGVRLVPKADQGNDLRPFYSQPGYTLALLAEFSGGVSSVTGDGAVEIAIADDGSNLLPESGWKRKIRSPRVSKGTTAALFEVELEAPVAGVKGLRELSGHLQYTVNADTQEVELGLAGLTNGAKGTELGAQISSIEEGSKKDGSQQMQLKLNLPEDALKKVYVIVDGARTALERRGCSGGGNTFTFILESKRAFPAKGQLMAEVFGQVQAYDVPFKLENITLLGVESSAILK